MTMIKDLLGFIREAPTGSAALRSKLATVEAAIPNAEAEVARLEAERAGKILDASDKDLDAIERSSADARRTVDRLRAAHEELVRRVATAEADEAMGALDRDMAAAEQLATEIAERVRREYPKAGRLISDLIDELGRAEAVVATVNGRLIEAGRGDECLPEVEGRALPAPADQYAEIWRLRNTVSLRHAPGFDGYGIGHEAAVLAGGIREQID